MRRLDDDAVLSPVHQDAGIAHGAAGAVQQGVHPFQVAGQEHIVGIQRRDEPAHRPVQGGVARRAAPGIVLAEETDARVTKALGHGAGIVGGTVIHHHDLKILAALFQHRTDGGAQGFGPVEDRDDDAEKGDAGRHPAILARRG